MRLIDADNLHNAKFQNTSGYGLYVAYKIGWNDAIDAICENEPTIEPKRGEWIDRSGGIEGAWNYCSVCGEQVIDLYDFCPNCGADMRNNSEKLNNSTISKMEQVDKDINVRSKNEL